VGDLTIRLEHGGTVATILQHVGVGPLGSDATLAGAYVFTDSAPATVWPHAPSAASGRPIPAGNYLCSGPDGAATGLRQRFAGMDAAGDWTLRVIDSAPGYVGTLDSWSLRIDGVGMDTCASPQGACCAGAACITLTSEQCVAAGGTFRGAGSACEDGPGNPTSCCPANFNRVNGLEVQDIFDFLNAWFAGDPSADIDGGGLAVSDIFTFITLWFSGC
jgi:hypothetical protein